MNFLLLVAPLFVLGVVQTAILGVALARLAEIAGRLSDIEDIARVAQLAAERGVGLLETPRPTPDYIVKGIARQDEQLGQIAKSVASLDSKTP